MFHLANVEAHEATAGMLELWRPEGEAVAELAKMAVKLYEGSVDETTRYVNPLPPHVAVDRPTKLNYWFSLDDGWPDKKVTGGQDLVLVGVAKTWPLGNASANTPQMSTHATRG